MGNLNHLSCVVSLVTVAFEVEPCVVRFSLGQGSSAMEVDYVRVYQE